MTETSAEGFFKRYRPAIVLAAVTLLLTAIPYLDAFLVLGDPLPPIMPTFTDETFNYARVQSVVEGPLTGGHPYFLEHRNDAPLVIFGGIWINALPQLAGLSFDAALMINFILWSLLFVLSAYWLLVALRIPAWMAVAGTILLYLQSYAHVWRPVNLQPVYPFYFLFYLALWRLMREQSRKNVIFLALITGVMFYLQSYFWQSFVITLGVLLLYAFARRNRALLKAAFLSLLLGGLIGLPVILYALWLSRVSPFFWESVGRLGLVNTHLPMAEVIYSGGWIGILLIFLLVLFWRRKTLREDREFKLLSLFIGISGLSLWIMQGSNLITGKLLETGEHVRSLLMPWLIFSTIGIGIFLWRRRAEISGGLRTFSVAAVALLMAVNVYYTYDFFSPFLLSHIDQKEWKREESYAKPFAWLQDAEEKPVVVWSDPHNYLATELPIFTRHFTLYAYFGMLELVPEGEIRERYLVSQFFNDLTAEDLKNDLSMYVGRQDAFHRPKTIERGIKICRLLFFWDKDKECGTIPTPQSLLGDAFFAGLEDKFRSDIRPNIKAYLAKYNVSYILKDKELNPQYRPEVLGAVRVYSDDRYEIWHL